MDRTELAKQLTELQDIEAIKQLKAEYCDICDDAHNPERIVTIFADDGIWEAEGVGYAKGAAELRRFLATFGETFHLSQYVADDLYWQVMKLLIPLLLKSPSLQVETWHVDEATAQLTIQVTATRPLGHCPVCQGSTRRVHSHYERTVADLPWAHLRLRLQFRVRKFFCPNTACARRIFTERLPQVVAPWARRTTRLTRALGHIGLALGGAAGARLSQQLGLQISRNTVLRLIRRLPIPVRRVPRVLGVDDFALRKRQTYGTVLIDLERHRPVALLPDRKAETLAHWLQQHPGVEVISRDRAHAYAEGARQGAPRAVQVADRFHLLQNLAETLGQVFTTHGKSLDAVNAALRQHPIPLSSGEIAGAVEPSTTMTSAHQRTAQRQDRRQQVYEQVWAWHRQGWTAPAIAQQLGLSLRTVQRDLRTPTFLGRQRRSDCGRSMLDPYQAILVEWWNAGCHTAQRLCANLRLVGYTGSYGLVAAYVRRLRQVQGVAPRQRSSQHSLATAAEPPYKPLTSRRATQLVLQRKEQCTDEEAHQLRLLYTQHAEVATAIELAQDFAHLVRQRRAAQFDAWLDRATTSTVNAFRQFASGLQDDYAAIKAAMTRRWSNGPVEGQINRLKMLKRQMFGRAHLELLSRRFLLAPRFPPRRVPSQRRRSTPPIQLLAA
jgi:transposase